MGREFLLGAVLGEWGADDHDNIYYLGGWVASGVIVIGDIRDIAATISRGDLVGTGLNLAALIPGYGDAAKVAAVVGKFVLKHPELVKPAVLLLAGVTRYSDETTEALSILRYSYGDEVIDVLKAHGTTDSTFVRLYDTNVNLFSIRQLLENTYNGNWAPSGKLTDIENFEKHYNKHVLKQNEWGYDIGRDLYRQKAVDLVNRRDHTVELYYQRSMDNIVVYDRNTLEVAIGTPNGRVQTYFIESSAQNFIDAGFIAASVRLN